MSADKENQIFDDLPDMGDQPGPEKPIEDQVHETSKLKVGYSTSASLPFTSIDPLKFTTRTGEEQTKARVAEIEKEDCRDISMVTEYSEEIFDYMFQLEKIMRPDPYYMNGQHDLSWSMRSRMMDWVVTAHNSLDLVLEILFLSVNYIDRFLSRKTVSLGKLQLAAATAVFIAMKYEETYSASISDIEYVTDGAYTKEQILESERCMLHVLNFELGWPGPLSFLRRISKADNYDLQIRTWAKYFLETTIMDNRCIGWIPSFTAAAAYCLSRLILRRGEWTALHVHYSNYSYACLHDAVTSIYFRCCENPRGLHKAIFDKYAGQRFDGISKKVCSSYNVEFKIPSPGEA